MSGAAESGERRWVRWIGPPFLRLVFATVRTERVNRAVVDRCRDAGQPVIFVFWHGQLLPLLHHHRGEGVTTLVSRHRDGSAVVRVLERLGYDTVRGSSTRGGVAGLRGLVRTARSGRDLAITPDGPQGPAQLFKPGAVQVARLTGHPIVPVAAGFDREWRLGSWDAFRIPRPFARLRIVYGDPVAIPRDPEGGVDVWTERLRRELDRLTRVAEEAG